ncbi:hypothetical protein CRYUN_Cryun29cG0021800 [Craigia yunnanensis]
MAYKEMSSPILSILVLLLLSLSLLPPTSARNTHLGKEVNEEIRRNLINGKSTPCHPEAGSSLICSPPYVDDSDKGKFHLGYPDPAP